MINLISRQIEVYSSITASIKSYHDLYRLRGRKFVVKNINILHQYHSLLDSINITIMFLINLAMPPLASLKHYRTHTPHKHYSYRVQKQKCLLEAQSCLTSRMRKLVLMMKSMKSKRQGRLAHNYQHRILRIRLQQLRMSWWCSRWNTHPCWMSSRWMHLMYREPRSMMSMLPLM